MKRLRICQALVMAGILFAALTMTTRAREMLKDATTGLEKATFAKGKGDRLLFLFLAGFMERPDIMKK